MAKLLSFFFLCIFGCDVDLVKNVNGLSCHQCSPDTDNCIEVKPDTLNKCFGLILPNMVVVCYSAFLNYDDVTAPTNGWNGWNKIDYDSRTGIYRGCGIKPNTTDYCSWYNTSLDGSNVSLISCESCDADACNDHRFDYQGFTISSNSDRLLLTISLLIINILVIKICI